MLGSTAITSSTSSGETFNSTMALPLASSTERRLSTRPSIVGFFAAESIALRLA
jgi:hypothetical protein